jgi:hypothetical protein
VKDVCIRVITNKKIMHLIKTKCKRCPRGVGVASCGQILNIGDKEKPSLQSKLSTIQET